MHVSGESSLQNSTLRIIRIHARRDDAYRLPIQPDL